MEARATFRGARISTSVFVTFIIALMAAFLLGGAGGYIVRAMTVSVSPATTTPVIHTTPRQTLLPNQS